MLPVRDGNVGRDAQICGHLLHLSILAPSIAHSPPHTRVPRGSDRLLDQGPEKLLFNVFAKDRQTPLCRGLTTDHWFLQLTFDSEVRTSRSQCHGTNCNNLESSGSSRTDIYRGSTQVLDWSLSLRAVFCSIWASWSYCTYKSPRHRQYLSTRSDLLWVGVRDAFNSNTSPYKLQCYLYTTPTSSKASK